MPLFPLPPQPIPVRPQLPKQLPLASLIARRRPAGVPTMTLPPLPTMRTRTLLARLRALGADDHGMTTAEYAIGTLAAAAFAAVLYGVISGDSVISALTDLVERALSVDF
ncbi:DUF4244 domain-containing protein [Haloechinothrix halophila]|uniref:DUF4244 domain-containing protein n=1 Tax=Haloechinothrix halophila TaxID=1069073 RepID=UPI002ED36AB1